MIKQTYKIQNLIPIKKEETLYIYIDFKKFIKYNIFINIYIYIFHG